MKNFAHKQYKLALPTRRDYSTPTVRFSDSLVFSVIDTETTSTGNHLTNRICEIAIIRTMQGKITDSFTSIVRPDTPISPDATRIHGITNAEAAAAPQFSQIAERVYGMIRGTILVCHNTAFDIPLVLRELSLSGLGVNDVYSLDTIRLAKKAFPGHRSYSLSSIVETLGLKRNRAHRAYDDCLATAELLWKCLARFEEMGLSDVAGLMAAGRNKQLGNMLAARNR